jgi:hypothetical protein
VEDDNEGGRRTQHNFSKLDRRSLGFFRIACSIGGLAIGIYLITVGSLSLWLIPYIARVNGSSGPPTSEYVSYGELGTVLLIIGLVVHQTIKYAKRSGRVHSIN